MKNSNNKSLAVLVILAVIGGLLLTGVFIFLNSRQEAGPSPTQNVNLTLDDIKPGDTNIFQIRESFGEPVNQLETQGGTSLIYNSSVAGYPNHIVASGDTVSLVREKINREEQKLKIRDILPRPKSTGEVKYLEEYGESFGVYIFPLDGLAFLAIPSTQSVYEVWRFQPTTMENILNTWGKDLINKADLPKDHY